MRPCFRWTRRTSARTCFSSRTSVPVRRDAATTVAPSASNARTIARPMPVRPPVTIATRPSREPMAAVYFLSVELLLCVLLQLEKEQTVGSPLWRTDGEPRSIAFSPDGRRLYVGTTGVEVLDAETGKRIERWETGSFVHSISVSGSVIAASGSGTVSVWSADGTKLSEWSGDSAVCLPDRIVSIAPGGGLTVADVLPRSADRQTFWREFDSLTATADGRCAMVRAKFHTFQVYDLDAPALLAEWSDPAAITWAWSANGKYLLVYRGMLQLRRYPAFELVHEWKVDGAWSMLISPDETFAITGGTDGRIAFLNFRTYGVTEHAGAHASAIMAMAWSPDGGTFATAGADGIRIWDRKGRCLRGAEREHDGPVQFVSVRDGRLVSGARRSVRVGDHHHALRTGDLTALQWNHRKNLLLATGGSVEEMDPETGKQLRTAFPRVYGILKLSRDGGRCLSYPYEDVLLADSRGECARIPVFSQWSSPRLAISDDGKKFFVADGDRGVIWSESRRVRETRLKDDLLGTVVAAFSPDGKILATGDSSHLIQLWDTVTGECLRTLRGSGGWIDALGFNGSILMSTAADRVVRIWDVESGKEKAKAPLETRGLCIERDGDRMWIGCADGTVVVYRLK